MITKQIRQANTKMIGLQKIVKVGKVAVLFAIVTFYYLVRAGITICLDYLIKAAISLKVGFLRRKS